MRVCVGWRVGVWSRQWSASGNSCNGSMCGHVVVITHLWGLQAKYNMNPEVNARIWNCTVLKAWGSGLWLIRILPYGSRNNLALKIKEIASVSIATHNILLWYSRLMQSCNNSETVHHYKGYRWHSINYWSCAERWQKMVFWIDSPSIFDLFLLLVIKLDHSIYGQVDDKMGHLQLHVAPRARVSCLYPRWWSPTSQRRCKIA